MRQVFPYSIESGLSQSGSCVLMLREPIAMLQVPVVIGSHEAQCILLAKQNVRTRRPMTHVLMIEMMRSYGLALQQVTIDHMLDGIFYATLHVSDGFTTTTFDSRATDAITIALLCEAPIMMDEHVLEEAGTRIADGEAAPSATPTLDKLEEELRRCEENEEYERAAEIQTQIDQLRQRQ